MEASPTKTLRSSHELHPLEHRHPIDNHFTIISRFPFTTSAEKRRSPRYLFRSPTRIHDPHNTLHAPFYFIPSISAHVRPAFPTPRHTLHSFRFLLCSPAYLLSPLFRFDTRCLCSHAANLIPLCITVPAICFSAHSVRYHPTSHPLHNSIGARRILPTLQVLFVACDDFYKPFLTTKPLFCCCCSLLPLPLLHRIRLSYTLGSLLSVYTLRSEG